MANIYPVVMAGGKGTRFWPLSRETKPKQLLPIGSEKTMIRQTVDRLLPIAKPENIFIIGGAAIADEIREQLPDLPPENIVAEPVGRNTAPCVALAAMLVAKTDPEGIMAIFPADHVVTNPDALRETISSVSAYVEQNHKKLATIGITPSTPETGYGYIQSGATLADGVFTAKEFCEKPDLATATQYLESGDYLWNAGMFFWKASTIIDSLNRHMPELMDAMKPLTEALLTDSFDKTMAKVYPTLPAESIDYGVMEKAGAEGNVVVAPSDPGWNDVGSWDSLYDLMPPDENGNRATGELIAIDSKNILAHNSNKLVAVVGADNLVVVETEDAILILDRDKAQDVRKVVDEIKNRKREDLL